MYRAALRSSSRALRTAQQSSIGSAGRRFASTFPADRRGTWKGAALRWGLAGAAVYWYNTSPVFAEEAEPRNIPPPPQFSDEDLPTVNAVIEQKRKEAGLPALDAVAESKPETSKSTAAAGLEGAPLPGSVEGLEAEADQQGAFNPETGEINWDCSCLGGMAHGPCGEEFKAAFSCFVYSTEEPKGMDCIEKFQGMQDCFRKYPEVYGAELEGDEDSESTPAEAIDGADPGDRPTRKLDIEEARGLVAPPPEDPEDGAGQAKRSEDAEAAIPRKATDATDANEGQ